MTEISVIVPVYNKTRYLRTMLDSVLNQNFTDFELILIDDGSTDDSGRIADEYANKDHRIKVHHIQNGGVSHARNIGLDNAHGEYITFVDSDDTIAKDYLGKLYKLITENSSDFVITSITRIWENSSRSSVINVPFSEKKRIGEILDNFAVIQKQNGIYGYSMGKIFSRHLLGNERFDESLNLAEDFEFYLRLYRKVSTIYFSEYSGYFYLQESENSLLNAQDDKINYLNQLLIQLKYRDFLRDLDVYSGDNYVIVNNNICNYMYYTLHYANRTDFNQKYLVVYKTFKATGVLYKGKNIKKKLILKMVVLNKKYAVWYTINAYRLIRKVIRGL